MKDRRLKEIFAFFDSICVLNLASVSWARDGTQIVPRADNKFQKAQALAGARVPVRMDSARWNEEALAGVQRDGRFPLLLPDTGARNDMEGDRGRVKMPGIDRTRRVFRIPNDNLPICGIRHDAPEQSTMRDVRLFLGWGRLCQQHGEAEAQDGDHNGFRQLGQFPLQIQVYAYNPASS